MVLVWLICPFLELVELEELLLLLVSFPRFSGTAGWIAVDEATNLLSISAIFVVTHFRSSLSWMYKVLVWVGKYYLLICYCLLEIIWITCFWHRYIPLYCWSFHWMFQGYVSSYLLCSIIGMTYLVAVSSCLWWCLLYCLFLFHHQWSTIILEWLQPKCMHYVYSCWCLSCIPW